MSNRRGFALMTVLWLTVAASILVLGIGLEAGDDVLASQYRVDSERAIWRAQDCLQSALATIDTILADARQQQRVGLAWKALDTEVLSSPLVVQPDCVVRIEAAGSRLDVNAASSDQLYRLFSALGRPDASALTDRLLDWIDIDDEPRARGAEAASYAALSRVTPRNAPIGDVRELHRVQGFEEFPLDSVLSVEPGRISINDAPVVVLASLPGFTAQLLDRIARDRAIGLEVSDILALAASVSHEAADSALAHFDEIANLATVSPDAWIVTTTGSAGTPAVAAHADVRMALDQGRAVVLRMRSW